jgi:hypothetical protein
MGTIDQAYTALTTGAPSAASDRACMGQADYVVRGMPEASLLIHKLEGVDAAGLPVCGSRMPIGPLLSTEQIDLIREWITVGAPRE